MKYLDLTLSNPAANLACDEALLEWSEGGAAQEVLRVWEPQEHFVVVGYGNQIEQEVRVESCARLGIPILRRCSGGGTVLQGPGCLNFALCLRVPAEGPLATIHGTNVWIMQTHRQMMNKLFRPGVQLEGQIDLTVSGRKFSGNAQRRRREFLLFHGTFLLHLDLNLMEEVLSQPSRQPDYRGGRTHREFVQNIGLPAAELKQALRACWNAIDPLKSVPCETIERLVRDKYSQPRWHLKMA